MKTKSLFGLSMRTRRDLRGLSRQGLSWMVGCDERLIERVETNLCEVPGEHLVAWANALCVQPEDIIFDYINQEARRMLLDAGITVHFKLTILEDDHDNTAPIGPHAGQYQDLARNAAW